MGLGWYLPIKGEVKSTLRCNYGVKKQQAVEKEEKLTGMNQTSTVSGRGDAYCSLRSRLYHQSIIIVTTNNDRDDDGNGVNEL